jgi:hypothetical protein
MYSRSAKGGEKGDPNRNPWLAKMCVQGLQEKFYKAEQDYFLGPRGQPETSLKIGDLRANKTSCNAMMVFLVTM